MARMVTHPARGFAPAILKHGLISRENVIDFAANKLGGCHYDTRRDKDHHHLLDAIRLAIVTDLHEGNLRASVDPTVFEDPSYRASKRPAGIGTGKHRELDPVLLEMMGAAVFLVKSPSVKELRALLGS